MIGFKAIRAMPTPLDLNGPILSFTQNVGSVTTCGVATFIGIATATFASGSEVANPAVGFGTITYQWYKNNEAVSDSDGVSGTASTTLTVISPTDGDLYYLEARFEPGKVNGISSTGRGNNEPLKSTVVSVTRPENISILTHPSNVTTITNDPGTFNIVAGPTNYTFGYQWTLNGEEVSDGSVTVTTDSGATRRTEVSGATTPSLTIASNLVGIQTVACKVSSVSACNSPTTSNEAELTVVSPTDATRAILNYEIVREDNTILYDSGEQNIVDEDLIFTSSTDNPSRVIGIYSPEKDIPVKITLKAAAGAAFGSNLGGEGGVSTFEYTLQRNTEYIIKLSPTQDPFGGRGGGGGGAFFYEKAVLLAACGGGGGASAGGNGGAGGGLGVAGESGSGRNSGLGGELIENGTLPTIGNAPSGTIGGRTSGCTDGDFYKDNGYAPCSDIGAEIPWRRDNGDPTPDSANTITRGFKAGGAPYRNNGGDSSIRDGNSFIGGGGSGAVGGNAATSSDSSGGGASGYSNGSVTILDTQLGGNTGSAEITIARQFDITPTPAEPPPPNVSFSVGREAAFSNTITFRRQSGAGPDTITFGPNGGTVSVNLSAGAVYTLDSVLINGSPGGQLRLSGGQLQLEDDTDGDFNDLTVTPNNGRFTSTSRYEFT